MTQLVLGISGGPFTCDDDLCSLPNFDGYWHDAAAVLVNDGVILSAHEEERHNRVKHTSAFPHHAVRACLRDAGCRPQDITGVGVYFTEEHWDTFLGIARSYEPSLRVPPARAGLVERLAGAGVSLAPRDLHFVHHHWCHALSAFHASGFPSSRVITLDGGGDNGQSGVVAEAAPSGMIIRRTFGASESLGAMYLHVTRHLGYGQFDEYKVMALAGTGSAERVAPQLRMFSLRPAGRFRIDWSFTARLRELCLPRRRGEPFTQVHRDVAAAIQSALEQIVLHVALHERSVGSESRLCLAGGVAHNCAMNGKLLGAGLFDDVFVHPASHDAGCALGAALAVSGVDGKRPGPRLKSASLGTDIDYAPAARLADWSELVAARAPQSPARTVARMIAAGKIVGVAVGRAEFGPRALGNRSLLADPRFLETRARINTAIKRREDYRPLAPVVLADRFDEVFASEGLLTSRFMSFALRVKDSWCARIPAVLHDDGTARAQTAEPGTFLADVIGEFDLLTGVPVLVNTSLNGPTEPIVDTVDHALAFLTTSGIDALCVAGWIAERRDAVGRIPHGWEVRARAGVVLERSATAGWSLKTCGPIRRRRQVSDDAAMFVAECLQGPRIHQGGDGLADELWELWRDRWVIVAPPDSSGHYGLPDTQ